MPMRPFIAWLRVPLAVGVLACASVCYAQNYEILDQSLDAERHGYTVLRVWGTHEDMGRAMGVALAPDIVQGIAEVRAFAGANYATLRSALGSTAWPAAGIEQEIAGIVDGVASVDPGAAIDAIDVKVLNTYSDWGYACRSHSCWGSRVVAPVKTLSTRRLDFGTPFPSVLHHVLCAWDPSDGSARWVNLAWPGYVAVVTGVNEHGTLVSLHDFQSTVAYSTGVVARSVATRTVLSDVGETAVAGQLGWAATELAAMRVATGTFVNVYAPEGYGGVFTCPAGAGCASPLITSNTETDGHSYPAGAEFLVPYYADPAPKTIADHYETMGHDGLHLLTVAFRGRGDMLLWAEGRQAIGTTPRIEFEWTALFQGSPGSDAGTDAGAGGASEAGAGGQGGSGEAAGGGGGSGGGHDGCGCRLAGSAPWASTTWLLSAVLIASRARRRRQRARPAA
jgi:hypothetical protein